ncbi:hypothetical protein HALLA_00060 (plasmid) [Halostagnicola larsenii XH-48]|uniref:Uncharacterized protein n=1 Tax=Halostagnicola larsenii XH-48 TaxID=797299 RepID=W0JSS2_9EURY|nr:hypothetical protein HALLA_00060 [Halostagnicola larsenii XH-48]
MMPEIHLHLLLLQRLMFLQERSEIELRNLRRIVLFLRIPQRSILNKRMVT